MAPPAWKNHNSIVKVLVPQKVTATIYDMESYQEWMTSTTTRKGQQLELSDLPDDLVESILERLSSGDRIRFGLTCKKNLSFFVTTTQHHQYQFRTIDKLPWMTTFSPDFFDQGMIFTLYEPRQQRGQPNNIDYLIRAPEEEGMRRTKIKACKKGWFLFLFPKEKDMICFLLFCPFNKRILQLPQLVGENKDLSSCRATFSSDDPSSPDCVFFFLSQYITPEKHMISTLDQKSGKWKTKFFNKLIEFVCSVVYHEGCFYCLSIQGDLAAYNVVQQTWNLITAPFFPLSSSMLPNEFGLVECEGKLIFATANLASYNEYNNLDAFRCSLFEFSSSTRTWVEKKSLGDHALFLSLPASFTVPVPSRSNLADRMYFYSSWTYEDCPIYYSFKDGRCHMSENGDYWSGVKRGMWIEPLPTS